MTKQNQRTWVIVGVILAIVILFLIFKKDKPESGTNNSQNSNTQTSSSTTTGSPNASTTPAKNNDTIPAPEGTFTLEGRLEASDNEDLGSIKLVTPEKTIYLRSRQDYSSLYGKQVVITAVGTSKVFRFDSIVEKK